eukprot:4748032-Pyramimonas_sp.AAC.1
MSSFSDQRIADLLWGLWFNLPFAVETAVIGHCAMRAVPLRLSSLMNDLVLPGPFRSRCLKRVAAYLHLRPP